MYENKAEKSPCPFILVRSGALPQIKSYVALEVLIVAIVGRPNKPLLDKVKAPMSWLVGKYK